MMRPLILSLAMALPAGAVLAEAPVPQITVTGQADVSAAPDMANLRIGVVARAKTAGDAMSMMSADTEALLAQLAALGIPAVDLQTSGLDLSPITRRVGDGQSAQIEIEGFQANTTINVRVSELAMLGEVLDAGVKSGANQIRGLSFGVQNPGPLADEARKLAVHDAMAKAGLYAEAAGLSLGDIISINEAGASAPRPVMAEAMRAADAGVPIAQGEVSLGAQVTMVISLSD